jgi:hemoglobin
MDKACAIIGLVIAGVAVSVILGNFKCPWSPEGFSKEKTLYDRLGGIFPIAAVVNDFSDALIVNPIVGIDSPNPFLRDWSRNKLDRLPGLKFMRTFRARNVVKRRCCIVKL